ncbi:hypothetical protein BTN49_2842 [Candidatus Enterovibrio escicola]|uniref:Transposase DDE domain-containing protein n=1 Tax=Candidatus Enterovibrio escicola TaxID=1927127 RepID=A0A2A5T0A8_9GAMM|nr:transposase [Candidatus Enterovibrio escacola]PCS21593.1 hypothetical protein BTN49_2842 [Candidatus Enterovibrio escacola]
MGWFHGDKGYISDLLKRRFSNKGVTLITGVKKDMKSKVTKLWNCLMLRKRFIISTIFDQLKIYPKSGIFGTVIVSALWLIYWRGLSRIHFN